MAALPTDTHAPAAQPRSAEEDSVRAFMQAVAQNVSREGPAAWRRELHGRVPSSSWPPTGSWCLRTGRRRRAASRRSPTRCRRFELRFGDDLRVDVLTSAFALVGSSYSEVQTDAQGQQHTDRGYFTGLAELREGHWRFRSAHWSSLPP